MMRKKITSKHGAPPMGIYSPAILAEGKTLYVSGQGAVNTEGKVVGETFEEQARQVFNNISVLLEAAGTSWANVVKVGIFMTNLDNFVEMNRIYKEYLTEPYPARTTVQAVLFEGIQIEVDCIALVPDEV
jgi:2-iminobutanoate/2-iminopropanoate deaminase